MSSFEDDFAACIPVYSEERITRTPRLNQIGLSRYTVGFAATFILRALANRTASAFAAVRTHDSSTVCTLVHAPAQS
jgi:hypothetical protein